MNEKIGFNETHSPLAFDSSAASALPHPELNTGTLLVLRCSNKVTKFLYLKAQVTQETPREQHIMCCESKSNTPYKSKIKLHTHQANQHVTSFAD